ncbi:MAG: hypothetical protein HY084_14445 [Gemmatimonadetes bacterium]|nr:hypothetical protein [Gemmatimonadota bacterium]
MNPYRAALSLAVLSLACGGDGRVVSRDPLSLPPSACAPCHKAIVESHARTAHALTSAPAARATILGDFTEGKNVLHTRSPFVSFTMEARPEGFFQHARDVTRNLDRMERFDLVVGSGRRGQTYLYWKDAILYELPVSYLTATNGWINSPGYRDGEVDFGRVITTRCLECHATSFLAVRTDSGLRYDTQRFQLGISCEKCHGDARQHVAWHTAHPADTVAHDIVNPAKIDRDLRMDVCALCHSGGRPQRTASFTYRAGERLDKYLASHPDTATALPDVHGDQVGLLRRSKCFRSSPNMSCSTCHDVHTVQRDPDVLSGKCLQCHQAERHTPLPAGTTIALARCATCHMPVQRSHALQINTATSQDAFSMRTHRIAVYPLDSIGAIR